MKRAPSLFAKTSQKQEAWMAGWPFIYFAFISEKMNFNFCFYLMIVKPAEQFIAEIIKKSFFFF
jgi:hypothetical protein